MHIKSDKQRRWMHLFIPLLFCFFTLASNHTFAQADGKKLFKQNCASCHTATDAKLVGPGLKGVTQRWADREKLHSWIRNSQEFLKTGDPYATKLFEEYNKSVMTPFPGLADEEITAIIDYVESGEADGPPPPPIDPENKTASAESPTKGLFLWITLGILFIIIIAVLGGVKRSLQTVLNERKGLPAPEEYTTSEQIKRWINTNKKLTAILTIVVMVWMLKQGWDALLQVGVYKGYKPEQPIAFSHQVHAGENGINCVYCHSGAEKSRHAGIPSANVCMNCHKGIQEGSRTGKQEISKIYAALGYDPVSQTYDEKKARPIKWIKVHNLPDHVYFNHSQHVKVGKVACQTCHGVVENMDVAEQHTDLTMGWCINCHRETNVQAEGNAYYDELHRRLMDGNAPPDVAKYEGEGDGVGDMQKYQEANRKGSYKGDGKTKAHGNFTVQDIGGLECAKCHY